MEFKDAYFNITLTIRVPSSTLIDNTLAANPTAAILEPYGATDADTEPIRYRRICYISPPYVSLFLAYPIMP